LQLTYSPQNAIVLWGPQQSNRSFMPIQFIEFRHLNRVVRALLLIAVCQSAGWAQATEDDRLEEALQTARSAYRRQVEEVAEQCSDRGQAQTANEVRASLVTGVRGKQLFFLPEALWPTGTVNTPPLADAAARQAWASARYQFADRLWSLAKELAHASPARIADAYRLAHEAAFVAPSHEAARHLVLAGHPGASEYVAKPAQSRHKEYDWPAGSYWRVKTDHFLIISDHSPAAALQAAQVLEEMHCVWRQMFAQLWLTPESLRRAMDGAQLPRRRRQHKVVLFANRDEYNRRLKQAEPQVGLSTGMYRDVASTSYFYVDQPLRTDTWRHELTHQLFQEVLKAEPGVAADAGFWAVEAIALYMESARPLAGYYELGGVDARRLQFARYRALHEQFYIPIEELAQLSKDQLQHHPEIRKVYSQAAGLAHFLIDGQHGELRSGFIEHLGDLYLSGKRVRPLDELTGKTNSQLDIGYHAFLKLTDRDLTSIDSSVQASLPIRALCLSQTGVTDRGLVHLRRLGDLEWLDLTNCRITDAGISRLPELPRLKRLSLEGTQVTDQASPRLAKFAELEELDLSRTAITNAGLIPLTDLKNLRSLWLTGADITDDGVATLMRMERLEHLNLNETAVSQEAWQELRDSLPRLGAAAGATNQ
jgi:hypothetical protein